MSAQRLRPMAGLVVLAALALAGCSNQNETETEPVIPVEVAAVQRGPIERFIAADGVLRALQQSSITPKISAPVARFYVNRGDHVRQGQLVAALENRDLRAAVAEAKAAFDQAAAAYRTTASASVPDEIVKARADVQSAREAFDAGEKLLASRRQLFQQGALARRLVDEAAVAYAQAKSQFETAQRRLQSVENVSREETVKQAAAQLDSARARYEASQAQLAYSEVHTPIAGVIADRAVWPGEMAAAGSPLLTVMDVTRIVARVHVPENQAAYLKAGEQAVLAPADGSQPVQGRVTVVSPAVDPESTTVEVWVEAPNPDERLRPGESVHVTIDAGAVPGAVLAPASALLPSEAGGTAVMVVTPDSIAHQHDVSIGIRNANQVEVLTGVRPGDRVVVSGGVGLQDGARVRVQSPGDNARP